MEQPPSHPAPAAAAAVFERFRSFPFDSDARFQAGLASLRDSSTGTLDPQRLEQAKAFFFSKFVAPLDLAAYRLWLADEEAAARGDRGDRAAGAVSTGGETQAELLADAADGPAAGVPETPAPSAPYSLSFQEIAEKVARGEPIPGIRQIPATVHDHASLASLAPRRKPWEQAAEELLAIVDVHDAAGAAGGVAEGAGAGK
ncbi:hypothetical protein HK105_203787 [Polyrhizophydium stewartii]|uniref:Uncharacterized protein n=1 Tax=Polyrhizophydium stewartii TaxID=2732419 RepID=A0ABR4NAW1_9FUNG|nr:hypothetical protein HK105_005457 [Polyrhizophydium stewartii]